MGRAALATALRERIVDGIHVGRLVGGERLPAVRALAAEYDVNERVVLAALRQLAREGFVRVRPRSGAYVAPPHLAAPEAAPLPRLETWLVATLLHARARGLAPHDLTALLRRCLDTRRVRAVCIECNADQRHVLCAELAADFGFVTEGVHIDEPAHAAPAAVRHADVLVTTVFHAKEVRRIAASIGKPCITVELRPEIMRDTVRWLRDGPLYYVATDPAFEPKLRRMVGADCPVDNLRFLLADRADLSAIPPRAPTFVMPGARELVRRRYGTNLLGRPIQPRHYFSSASAQELLGFLVRMNIAPDTPDTPEARDDPSRFGQSAHVY